MLDDVLVGARGTRVRCTECTAVFRVAPRPGGSLEELGAALSDEPWRVMSHGGEVHEFASVSALSRAILAGLLGPNDMLARGLLPTRRLGEVLELVSFFARARQPKSHGAEQQEEGTLPGLANPEQRAELDEARQTLERLQEHRRPELQMSLPPPAPEEPPSASAPPARITAALPSAVADDTRRPTPLPLPSVPVPPPARITAPLPPLPSPAPRSAPPPARVSMRPSIPDLVGPLLAVEAAPATPRAAELASPAVTPVDPSDRVQLLPPVSSPPRAETTPGELAVDAVSERSVTEPPDAEPALLSRRDRGAARRRYRVMAVGVLSLAAAVLLGGLVVGATRQGERSASPTPTVDPDPAGRRGAPTAAASVSVAVPTSPAPTPTLDPAPPSSPAVATAPPAASSAGDRHDSKLLANDDPRRLVADGLGRLHRGDLSKAEATLRAAIAKNPYDSEALTGLGDVARVRGQRDKARELYAQAISVNPTYFPALLGLGDLAWDAGDKAEARRRYEFIVGRFGESAYPRRVKTRLASLATPESGAQATEEDGR